MESAFECYKRVLEVKPGYGKAITGIQNISDFYEKALKKAIKKKEIEFAKNTYVLFYDVDPTRAKSYKKTVENLSSKIEKKKKIRIITTF